MMGGYIYNIYIYWPLLLLFGSNILLTANGPSLESLCVMNDCTHEIISMRACAEVSKVLFSASLHGRWNISNTF